MKRISYICDKCGKELTEWEVVEMDSDWSYQLRVVGCRIPYEYHIDLCKECAEGVLEVLKKK